LCTPGGLLNIQTTPPPTGTLQCSRFGHVRVTEGRQPHPNHLSEVIRSGVVNANPFEQMSGIYRPQRKRAFLSLFHPFWTHQTPPMYSISFASTHSDFRAKNAIHVWALPPAKKPAYPPRFTEPRIPQPWELAHRPPEGPAGRHINGDGPGPPR